MEIQKFVFRLTFKMSLFHVFLLSLLLLCVGGVKWKSCDPGEFKFFSTFKYSQFSSTSQTFSFHFDFRLSAFEPKTKGALQIS